MSGTWRVLPTGASHSGSGQGPLQTRQAAPCVLSALALGAREPPRAVHGSPVGRVPWPGRALGPQTPAPTARAGQLPTPHHLSWREAPRHLPREARGGPRLPGQASHGRCGEGGAVHLDPRPRMAPRTSARSPEFRDWPWGRGLWEPPGTAIEPHPPSGHWPAPP